MSEIIQFIIVSAGVFIATISFSRIISSVLKKREFLFKLLAVLSFVSIAVAAIYQCRFIMQAWMVIKDEDAVNELVATYSSMPVMMMIALSCVVPIILFICQEGVEYVDLIRCASKKANNKF